MAANNNDQALLWGPTVLQASVCNLLFKNLTEVS